MTRILRVLAPNPGPFTLEGTNTWIVGERPSVVIDPGPNDSGHLLAVLDEAAPVAAVVLTHRHPDHAEGAARFAEASGAPVHALRPLGGEQMLRAGQVLEAGSAPLRVVGAPGHTPDHVCLLLEEAAALFTGDAVLGRGTSVVDPPEGDMKAYVHSLQALRDLVPRTIYPGHGPIVFDAVRRLNEYIAHRARREQQVLAALAEGADTPAAMVPGIYGDEVAPGMFPVAERSVLAHLLKLEREGRVARTGKTGEDRFAVVTPRECRRCGRPAVAPSKLCRRCQMALLQESP